MQTANQTHGTGKRQNQTFATQKKRQCLSNRKVSSQKLCNKKGKQSNKSYTAKTKKKKTKKRVSQNQTNSNKPTVKAYTETDKSYTPKLINRSITYEKFYSQHKYNQIIIIPLEQYIIKIKIKLDQYNII